MQDALTKSLGLSDQQAVQLRQTYEARCSLFFAQPLPIKQFFIVQSQFLARAFLKDESGVHFQLPDQVIETGSGKPLPVPEKQRHQKVGSKFTLFKREAFHAVLGQHLARLEESPEQGVSVAASLTRLTTVLYMVQGMLPEVRAENSRPPLAETGNRPGPNQDGSGSDGNDPQVEENLLRRSAAILAVAAQFAPYILADEQYRLQCSDVLCTLVRQGQDSAVRQTEAIIDRLKERAVTHQLDRGLSLSLPYFDDRKMELRLYDFEVIPAGRIPFDPRCVLMAARAERAQVAKTEQFSPVTRRHLLSELALLEVAFEGEVFQAAPASNFG
jgi:hypothetical protein